MEEELHIISTGNFNTLYKKCNVSKFTLLLWSYIHMHGCILKSLSLICGLRKISNRFICR